MNKFDASRLAASARRYFELRRRYWRFSIAGVTMAAVNVAYGAAFGGAGGRMVVADIPVIVLMLGFLVCCIGILLTWVSLMNFRCPQCGKRFILSWVSSWPTSACKHCGLNLGESKSDRFFE